MMLMLYADDSLTTHTPSTVVHRLTASLALLIYLSPSYDTELGPLLEVLKVKEILKSKLSQGVVKKKDVRRLIEEVTDKLCP